MRLRPSVASVISEHVVFGLESFDANEIGMDLLGQVDDQMLKDIGVSIGGHRLRIRNAIAKLAPAPVAEVNVSPLPRMRPLPRLRSAAS